MTRANKQGYDAYFSGIGIDDNFYADGTDEALEFVEGWLEAERYDINVLGE